MQTFIPKGNLRGFIMPDFVFKDMRLCLGAKMLFAVMCNFAGDKDHCWPSHNTLAKMLDCSVSTIKTYIKQLLRCKYIAMGSHHIRSCLYLILQPITQKNKNNTFPKTYSCPCRQNLATPQSKSDYKYNLNEIKINPPLPPNNELDTEQELTKAAIVKKRGGGNFSAVNKNFEEFFVLYPKKEGKELARSMWFRLARNNRMPSLETLKSFLSKICQSHQWQKDYGRYIPMASSFLRGERWKDDIDAVLQRPIQTSSTDQISQVQRTESYQQFLQLEQERCQKEKEKNDSLRSIYETIASKFHHGVNSVSFGLWAFLYSKGLAPNERDIPQDTRNIHFLEWLNRCKQHTIIN